MTGATSQPRAVAASARPFLSRLLRRTVGPGFVRRTIDPLRVRGPRLPYDAKRSFEGGHELLLETGGITDAGTIKRGHGVALAEYHYNAVENAIVEHALERGFPARPAVLDVGSGAGHWVDFYRRVFEAERLVGVEISEAAAEALRARYADEAWATFVLGDVSADDFAVAGAPFDVVNAVSVMYHVVDDVLWRRTVSNLGAQLAPGGLLVVTGHFGLRTRDIGFVHRQSRAYAAHDVPPGTTLVYKRIRSLRAWKACAAAAGLEVAGLVRTRTRRTLPTPENNVLVLRRPG